MEPLSPSLERGEYLGVFKKPEYERWASLIDSAALHRQRREREWEFMYDCYRGNQSVLGTEDEIIVNLTYGHGRVIESALYYEDPYLRVRPRTDIKLAPKAQLLEQNLNSIWYAERIGREVRKCVIDAYLTGIGWMMIGYSDYHDPNLLYRSGRVYVRRVNPLDLYVEEGVSSVRDTSFFARRGRYGVRWLKKLFKGKEWKPDGKESVFRRKGLGSREGIETQATLWEVLDLVEQKLLILSPQHKDVVYSTDYPYNYFDGPMYVPLIFVDDPNDVWPISMAKIVLGQQDELNKIRTQQMIHRKRYNRRYLLEDGTMNDDELSKFEAGEDGTITKCLGDPNRVLVPVKDAPLDQNTTVAYQQDIRADMREILGVNEYLRGGFIPRTKTAQEASMIQQGSSVRVQNMYMYLHEFIVDIARRVSLIIQNEYDNIQHLTTMVGGELTSVQWTKEDIAGEYEIEIEIGSTLPPQPIPFETLLQSGTTVGQGATAPGGTPSGTPGRVSLEQGGVSNEL